MPAWPSTLCSASSSRASSPKVRNRGADTVTATGSRTIVSLEAAPTLPALQATAVRRTVPLKSGSWNSALAVPSGPTWTMPENKASVASTGGLPCTDISPPSPPERSLPRSARMPSISRP